MERSLEKHQLHWHSVFLCLGIPDGRSCQSPARQETGASELHLGMLLPMPSELGTPLPSEGLSYTRGP
jgi:hypothetical protein